MTLRCCLSSRLLLWSWLCHTFWLQEPAPGDRRSVDWQKLNAMKKCSDQLHLSVWGGSYSFSLKQERSKIPRCGPALFVLTGLAKQGDKRFHEGFSKQAHLLCQNHVSSVRLLRLDDYIPWSQYCILHLWVNQSTTVSAMLMLTYGYFLVKALFSSAKTAWCLMQVWNLPPR